MNTVNDNAVIEVLKQCFDPEIPIDLWSLGLIYNIEIDKNESTSKYSIKILMTLTTPGCSMGSYMAEDIKLKLSGLDEINSSEVNITFDPPWKPEMMNDSAKEKLGFIQKESDDAETPERDWE